MTDPVSRLRSFQEVLDEYLVDPEFRALWEQRNDEEAQEEEPPELTAGTGWCAPSP